MLVLIINQAIFIRSRMQQSSDMYCKELGNDTIVNTMSQNPKIDEQSEWVIRSSLYQQFLAERKEILKHKWLESERMGRDIGFEAALLDWVRNHRKDWRNARRSIPEPAQQF